MDQVPQDAVSPGGHLVVAVLVERAPGETRVALVPDAIGRLRSSGIDVLVETGAGAASWFADADYVVAGAEVVSRADALRRCDVLVTVGSLSIEQAASLRAGQAVVGMLRPRTDVGLVRALADAGVTAISLDELPRTVSRAQAMDALSSQANVAGYKAALVAADALARFFPMLITAAGTSKPAEVLVLGAGVAGLQAMGTARRLGAVVTGYDVRPEARTEIVSVGARVLELSAVASASGEGGYARALSFQLNVRPTFTLLV